MDVAKLLGFPREKIRHVEDLAKYRNVEGVMEGIRKLREDMTLPNGGRRYRAKMVGDVFVYPGYFCVSNITSNFVKFRDSPKYVPSLYVV